MRLFSSISNKHIWAYTDILFGTLAALAVGSAMGVAAVLDVPELALIGVLGILVGLIFIRYPMVTLYLLVVVLALASGIPRGRFVPTLRLNEVFLLVASGIVLLALFIYRRRRWLAPSLVISILGLVIGTVIVPIVAYTIRGYRFSTSELLSIAAPIQYLFLMGIFAFLPNQTRQRVIILHLMAFCATVASIIGLLQAANIGPVVSFLQTWFPSGHLEAAEEAGRITSVFGAWNVLGVFLMVVLLLLAAVSQYKPFFEPRWAKWNFGVAVVTSLACLLGSGSYASLFGLAGGFFIMLTLGGQLKQMGRTALYAIGIALISGIMLSPLILIRFQFQFESGDGLIPNTLAYRFQVWETIYIPLIMRDPIWGVSPTLENLSFAHAESQYLFIWFRLGIFALIGQGLYVLAKLIWLWGLRRDADFLTRQLASFLFALIIMLSVMGLTNPVFTYSGSIDFLWIIIGLIVNLQGRDDEPAKDNRSRLGAT